MRQPYQTLVWIDHQQAKLFPSDAELVAFGHSYFEAADRTRFQ